MSRPVALAVVGLALLAALLLPLRVSGEPGTQATTPGYEWEVLPGIQRDRSGVTTERLWITDDWHSYADSQHAIDLAPEGRGILDGCPYPVTDTSTCASDPVHATFRNISGGQDLDATFEAIPVAPGTCKGVSLLVTDEAENVVAVVHYKHVIQSSPSGSTRSLSAMAASPALLGTLSVPHPNNPRLDGTNAHWTNILETRSEMVDKHDCENTGPHLHQSTVPGPSGVVQRNRDAAAALGISGDFTCIASSMWLWKIASSTPTVTATKAPTQWVCPSTLTVQTGTSVGQVMIHGGTVAVDPIDGPYVASEPVTLTAMARTGFGVIGWSGDVGTDCPGTGSCTVTMDQDRTVRAVFGIELTVSMTAGGSVTVTKDLTGGTANTATPWSATCDASCALAVPLRVQRLTVTATANDGYQFSEWGGACAGTAVTEPCMVTLNARAANPGQTISATFAADADTAPTVTIAARNGVTSVTEGEDAEFTLTRTGDATDELVVKVSVTGNAVSGTQPTEVRFAETSPTFRLTVATLDDSPENSSVTAKIVAGTGYVLGDAFSATVTVTDDDDPPAGKLPPPGNLSVTNKTQTSLTLNWDTVEGADGYQVQRTGARDPEGASGTTSHPFTDLSRAPPTPCMSKPRRPAMPLPRRTGPR